MTFTQFMHVSFFCMLQYKCFLIQVYSNSTLNTCVLPLLAIISLISCNAHSLFKHMSWKFCYIKFIYFNPFIINVVIVHPYSLDTTTLFFTTITTITMQHKIFKFFLFFFLPLNEVDFQEKNFLVKNSVNIIHLISLKGHQNSQSSSNMCYTPHIQAICCYYCLNLSD